jgi:hypothetical protein
MTARYETTRSQGDAPLMLIFAEGTWDSLPFEIRLLRPWYGGEVVDSCVITARQCIEIANWGYCIAAAIEPAKSENHCSDHMANTTEATQQHQSAERSSATCLILTPIFDATSIMPELDVEGVKP